jgi:hypothetical protein
MKSSIRKKDKSKNVSRQVRIILSVLRKYVYLTIDGIEITLSKEQRKKIVNEYILEWSNHECIDTMVLDDMFYLKIWHNPYKGGHSKKLVNVTDVRFVFTNLTNHHMKLLEVDNKIFT